jgi:hypothetical protein
MMQLTNDKGETLDLASSLATYLANRTKRVFCAGDWLKRLTGEELAKIQRLSEASKTGDNDALFHLMQIAIIIVSAETQQQTISFEPEMIEIAPVLASFVSLERHGLIKINSELSYSKFAEISMTMTDKGLAMGDQLMAEINKQTFH